MKQDATKESKARESNEQEGYYSNALERYNAKLKRARLTKKGKLTRIKPEHKQ